MPKSLAKFVTPPSSFVRVVLLGWFALTIGAMLLLRAFHIGLGQGSFAYRFSTMQGDRMARALWLVPIAALAVLALNWTARGRKIGLALGATAVVLLSAWTLLAPRAAMVQHSFNLRSPSQDGAFVNELHAMTSLRDYLRDFDARIQKSPAELRGTRVISNPPGTTILFAAVAYVWPTNVESPGRLERFLQRRYNVNDEAIAWTMITVQLAVLLCALWMLSAFVLYRVARLFLAPPGAMLCVLIAWFNPSTVHFVPGKDPMQLLTVALMMWTWLLAWKHSNAVFAALFGTLLVVGATIGLIHIWVALALVVACAWESRARTLHLLLPAAAGGFAVMIAIYLLTDWNIPKTLFTVYRRFAQIQRELALNHLIWLLIGLPIFLLFVSPSLPLYVALALRTRRRLNFGARLAIVTIATMLVSYVIGVPYELPRLWVVFIPLLALGLMSATPLGNVRHDGRAARAIMWIAIVHLAFTAAHWSMLDARESELRLSGDKPAFFDSPDARDAGKT